MSSEFEQDIFQVQPDVEDDETEFEKEIPSVEDGLEEVVETEEEPEFELEENDPTKLAYVTDCLKVNVRQTPHLDAPIVCVLDALAEVLVDESLSTDKFYKVYTSAGLEGFCVRKFIAIKL